jgi:hypothetical protein
MKKQISTLQREKALQAADALEELLWLLSSKRQLNLKVIPEILRKAVFESVEVDELRGLAGNYVAPNPNKHFLIGVLPRLFQDTVLFPTNEDIAEFARTVLELNLSNVGKRSKYELIGVIVCRTNDFDEKKLSHLVGALQEMIGNEEKLKQIADARKTEGLSWNEAIQRIGSMRNDERD